MLTVLAAAVALLTPDAAAQSAAGEAVFVSPFQAKTRAAAATASLLTAQVEQALKAEPGVQLRALETLPSVGDLDAYTYANTCPQGQFVGCAFVLGDLAVARVTVAGAVEQLRGRRRVEVHVIDMDRAEDVLAFDAEFAADDEAEFATALARLVRAVLSEEAGLVADIRAQDDPNADADAERDRAVAAAQLEALSKEIGGSDTVDRYEGGTVVREKVTVEELASTMEDEGSKPWERLGMQVDEYVRYRNSGLDLLAWRDRAAGRKGQLIARGGVGYGRGPSSGAYYVLEAKAAADLQVVETWAWQTANSSAGVNWELNAAYGILPILEAGLLVGGQSGVFTVQTGSITEGQSQRELEPAQVGNSVLYFGPQALVALLPTSRFRPVVGAEVRYWQGNAVQQKVEQLDPDYPTFNRPWMLTAGGRIGGEARMGDNLDLYIHLPFHMLVGGKTSAQQHNGTGYLGALTRPEEIGTFGAGVQAGVQVRFLGGAPKAKGLDAFGDPD